ncbi:hypothetical protein VSS37_10575, partial [Candidatus Thiothrix sp. Deng01]
PVGQPTLSRDDHTPQWPQAKLDNKQRTAKPQEEYSVILQAKDGKTYSYPLDFKRWETLKPGQAFTASVGMGDEVLELAAPEKP